MEALGHRRPRSHLETTDRWPCRRPTSLFGVLNGTNSAGVASRVGAMMTALGYNVVEVGDFESPGSTDTSVGYPAGSEEAARTLAYATSATNTGQDGSDPDNPVLTLVIGNDFTGVRTPSLLTQRRYHPTQMGNKPPHRHQSPVRWPPPPEIRWSAPSLLAPPPLRGLGLIHSTCG